jgi:formate dehydrogenase subunit gamma
MATEPADTATGRPDPPGPVGGRVRRFGRGTRWLHAVGYVVILALLGTGWWLLLGREGDPSPLARITGSADPTLHTRAGWLLVILATVVVVVGARGVGGFVAESVRLRRRELAWFRRWPAAVLTGRFGWHDGRFDPGQRIANVILLSAGVAVLGSGAGMALLHGGDAFAWLVRIHRWSTYALTPVLLGHIVIAAGVLPGYRGAWRSMHLGGRLDPAVARRLWPGWFDRQP